jgi:hypothetical protein
MSVLNSWLNIYLAGVVQASMIGVCCGFDVLMKYFYFQVKEILEQILQSHPKKTSKVLLVVASDQKTRQMSSSLKLKNCTVIDGSHGSSFTICSRYSELNSIVVFLQFPVSAWKLKELVNLLTKPFSCQSLHAN